MAELNLHSGHRQRLINKVLKENAYLEEHELLEVLLYDVLPRIDTNPLAHKLINSFGTLKGVLSATENQLKCVSGVGDKTASYIVKIGKIFANYLYYYNLENPVNWMSFDKSKAYLFNYFRGKSEEEFIMVLLDRKYNTLFQLSFEDKNKNQVSADIPEIVNAFAIYKPKYAIVAHNHPSDICAPSGLDNFTTMKLNLLCQMNGVTLADHIIVSKDTAYSYNVNNKLDIIKDASDINTLLGKLYDEENIRRIKNEG